MNPPRALGTVAAVRDEPAIVWREDPNVYQPIPRKLEEFLEAVGLGGDCTPLRNSGMAFLIFVQQNCMEAMESHVRSDILNEQAGILCGKAYQDDGGGYYISVTSALAVDTISSPGHFSFHEKSWDAVWGKIEADSNIVGWYHSHPGIGVFMSATDLRTQALYFNAPWQIAVVIDPISRETGIFHGPDGERVLSERIRMILPVRESL